PVDLDFDIVGSNTRSPGSLVILHGLFGSKRNWLSLSESFAKRLNIPIYALDLRNHGSSPHAEPMTYSTMADDVLHFCGKQKLSQVSLLGHSMGGKVAMALALRNDLPDDLLTNLIIADIAPSRGQLSADFRGYVEAMQKIEGSWVTTRKEAQEILEPYEKDHMTRAFLLTNLVARSGGDSTLKFRVPLDIIDRAIPDLGSFPYEPGESEWNGRTLFIKGDKSNYINGHNIPIAQKLFPRMKLETLPTAHWG
ncbi:alpha/beta-hydrolase, partial [Rickenella mellea]